MTDELPGAGPELDAMVGKAIEAQGWYAIAPYSISTQCAMNALKEWREWHPGHRVRIDIEDDGVEVLIYRMKKELSSSEAITLSVAICHAILRATREVQS